MRTVLYLTESEELAFGTVFAGAKEVEVDGKPQLRVGLANGALIELLNALMMAGETNSEHFLREFVQRMIRAGILVQQGVRKDTEVVGVLQILILREQIVVHELKRRATKMLSAADYEIVKQCFECLRPGVHLQKFVRETLGVPEEKVHTWGCRIVDWGIAENIGKSKSATDAQWVAVAKEFGMFDFVVDNKLGKGAPVESKSQETKPAVQPEPKEITVADVVGFLVKLSGEIESLSKTEREKVEKFFEAINEKLTVEKDRVAKAMMRAEPVDTTEYNRLVTESERLKKRLALSDNTALTDAYAKVIVDLTQRFLKENPVVKKQVVVPPPAPKPVPKPVAESKPVEKKSLKPKAEFWRSQTGFSVLQLAMLAVAKSEKSDWLMVGEIYAMLAKLDKTAASVLLSGALYDETRRVDGSFEKREVTSAEKKAGGRGTKYLYRLTAKGNAAAKKLTERSLTQTPLASASKKPKRARQRKIKNARKLCLSERIAKNWAESPSPFPDETLILKDVHALITANGEAGFPVKDMAWGMSRRLDLFQKELVPVEEGQKRTRGFSTYRYKLTPKALKRFGAKKK